MAKCQQLGRLGFRGSYRADWVSEPGCWRDPPCTYVHIYFLTSRSSSCSAREGSRMRLLVLSVFLWVLCLWSVWLATYVCIYMVCMCVLSACADWEYIFSLNTGWTRGHGAAQPCPFQLVGFRLIFSPNISQAGLRKFSRAPFEQTCGLDIIENVFSVMAAQPWDEGCSIFLNRSF